MSDSNNKRKTDCCDYEIEDIPKKRKYFDRNNNLLANDIKSFKVNTDQVSGYSKRFVWFIFLGLPFFFLKICFKNPKIET